MFKKINKDSKLAFVMLCKSMRKQSDDTLHLIIRVATLVLDERKTEEVTQ